MHNDRTTQKPLETIQQNDFHFRPTKKIHQALAEFGTSANLNPISDCGAQWVNTRLSIGHTAAIHIQLTAAIYSLTFRYFEFVPLGSVEMILTAWFSLHHTISISLNISSRLRFSEVCFGSWTVVTMFNDSLSSVFK